MRKTFDDLVVGAGVTGCVLSERLATLKGRRVLLIEKRRHIAGNAYDEYDSSGILIHKYGPHIFHTHDKRVFEYLSSFTKWHPYEHRVRGEINGMLVSIPFNLKSLRTVFREKGESLKNALVRKYGKDNKVPVWALMEDADSRISELGRYVYNNVFLNYTKKQWGLDPTELDKSVTSRVPVAVTEDDRYFYDQFQVMPLDGYTKMFERMIDCPGITLMTDSSHRDVLRHDGNSFTLFGSPFRGNVYFTGALDELFDYKYGALPYRGLRFEFKTFEKEFFQSVCTVNYPNEHDYTRITEFKHCTGQKSAVTTVTYEYPDKCDIQKGDIPYYPIPRTSNSKMYEQYKEDASKLQGLVPVGRLAEYRYINMSQAVIKALETIDEKEG